jgi:CheY-like chemotaxis protein
MDRIFDAYYSTKATGSGLGLHVVSAVLRRLGGTIELDKSYQNGARFILLIPPSEVSETNSAKSDSTEAEPRPSHHTVTKILLLEDEQNQVALLSAYFDSLDLDYACFSDGKQLLEEVESVEEAERDQLCCLLDITVTTGLGGLEILQPLREVAPQARIILASGYSNRWESNRELFKKSNALFLPKPYTFDELNKKMNESQTKVR